MVLAFVALEVEKVYAEMAKDRQREAGTQHTGNQHTRKMEVPEIFPELPEDIKNAILTSLSRDPNDEEIRDYQERKFEILEKQERDRLRREREARDQAAKAVGVSGKMVSMAKAVKAASPELDVFNRLKIGVVVIAIQKKFFYSRFARPSKALWPCRGLGGIR